MFIYIGCAGGGTSSMFCQRMVKEINEHDENLSAVFDDVTHVFQKRLEYGTNFDVVFAYGAASDIRSFNAFDYGNLFDAVLIAPQVSFSLDKIKQLLTKYPSMVRDLPRKLFGTMDSQAGYDLMLDLLLDLDLRRGYASSVVDASKDSDKDIELYVAGAGSKDLYWKSMFEFLEKSGIRYIVTPYSLENLYDFAPSQDFELRFVFGQLSVLTEEDFARVARRIDGFLVNASAVAALKKRKPWLEAYHIPAVKFDDTNVKKALKKGKFVEEEQKFWDFLQKVQQKTEYTTEISVDKFERKELTERKKALFGLISWE